jgi:hypothetical protein
VSYVLDQILSCLSYFVHIHKCEHNFVNDWHSLPENLDMSAAVRPVVVSDGRLSFVVPLELQMAMK